MTALAQARLQGQADAVTAQLEADLVTERVAKEAETRRAERVQEEWAAAHSSYLSKEAEAATLRVTVAVLRETLEEQRVSAQEAKDGERVLEKRAAQERERGELAQKRAHQAESETQSANSWNAHVTKLAQKEIAEKQAVSSTPDKHLSPTF